MILSVKNLEENLYDPFRGQIKLQALSRDL